MMFGRSNVLLYNLWILVVSSRISVASREPGMFSTNRRGPESQRERERRTEARTVCARKRERGAEREEEKEEERSLTQRERHRATARRGENTAHRTPLLTPDTRTDTPLLILSWARYSHPFARPLRVPG